MNDEGFFADGDPRHAAALLGSLVEHAGGRVWFDGTRGRYDFGFVFMADLLLELPEVLGHLERGEEVVVHSLEQGIDEKLSIMPATATLTIESHGTEVVRDDVDIRVLAADLALLVRALSALTPCLRKDDAIACDHLLDDADRRLSALSAKT